MIKRLKNRKADIKYIRTIISRLPDDTAKRVELARLAFIEKGVTKGKFSVLNLKDLSNLGVDIKILSRNSATPRSVNVALGLRSNKDKTSMATNIISWAIVVAILFIVPLMAIEWKNIKAIFAKNPQDKCRIYIQTDDKDMYCKEDGSHGSYAYDECLLKAPYFGWIAGKYSGGSCSRIKYESRSACIADGREGPITNLEAPDGLYVRCLNDGSWSAVDAFYEDYLLKKSIITCKNVTSYDYNWDNDMLCTKPDGSQFYTSYDGARAY